VREIRISDYQDVGHQEKRVSGISELVIRDWCVDELNIEYPISNTQCRIMK
jgi:hypothetical protein